MKPVVKNLIAAFLIIIALMATGAVFSGAAAYLYLSPNLPSVESIRDVRLQTPLRIYSSDGKLIGEFGEKRRDPIKLDEVPQTFIDALLAAEDVNFYSHNGVSLKGLARAITELIATGEKGSGGSTLTMQLTRNVFLSLDTKYIRKFNEILLSLKLERELSKAEILELYVNYMFLGKRAYGIQAAAQVYYGKDLTELSLAQLAMIAGLFQGPSTQNPIVNPTRAIERRNWILRRMETLDFISLENFKLALKEPITASYHGSQLDINAPYVAELAREKAIRSFGLKAYTDGYKVITTVDSNLQLQAQKAVVDGILAYDQRHGYRGPEQNLGPNPVPYAEADPAANESTTTDESTVSAETTSQQKTEENTAGASEPLTPEPHPWVALLQDIPAVAELEPAAILFADETSAQLLLKSGEQTVLAWEDGLASARPYINENTRGASPKSATDVVQVGDIIRVVKSSDTGRWNLSQLPEVQASLVSLNPLNGAIKSVVGGFDFFENQFNRATQAYRQPGSNLKPFLYATGLENGMTAATLINDSPVVRQDAGLEGTWRPKNDGDKFYGDLRLRKALYLSINMASIRILQEVGIDNARDSLERFGFDPNLLANDLTLALGNASITPIDLAAAWASFANGGYKVGAHLINRVYDNDGRIIYEAYPDTVCTSCNEPEPSVSDEHLAEELLAKGLDFELAFDPAFDKESFELPLKLKRALGWLNTEDYPKAAKVLSDQVAFLMDSILKDVIRRGTGTKARALNRADIAGKTGTTNGPVDVWFSGYNKDFVTTTWVGFDKNTNLGNAEFGSTAALPIWIDYMEEALKQSEPQPRIQPAGIVSLKINPDTGKRANIDDPDAIFEYFRAEYAPELETQTADTNTERALEEFTEEIF